MTAVAGRAERGDRWAPWVMLGVTLLALLAGWALRSLVEGRTRLLEDPGSGVSLAVPVGWQSADTLDGQVLAARDSSDPLTTVAVDVLDLGDRDVKLVQQTYIFRLGQTLKSFRVIDAPAPLELGVDEASRFTYAYIDDPAGSPLQSRQYPVVVAGSATLVARGGKLYVITTGADAERLDERQRAALDRIVQSVRLP